MTDRIFDDGLKKKSRHQSVERRGSEVQHNLQAVAKTHLLDCNVGLGERDFIAKRGFGSCAAAQCRAQQIAQAGQHLASQFRVFLGEYGNVLQRVEGNAD